MAKKNQADNNAKNEDLQFYRKDADEQLTTHTGVIIDDTDNSLKVGSRGATLHEDFQFQEKLSAFDRERIPERVVHARGSGAHGYFQPYESMADLAATGVGGSKLVALKEAWKEAKVEIQVVSKFGGIIKTVEGQEVGVDKTFLTAASVMFDAIHVPGGKASIEALKVTGDALTFINEAFKHCKPIAATAEGVDLLQAANLKGVPLDGSAVSDEQGVIAARKADASQTAQLFVQAIAQHRYWNRFEKAKVPA